MIRLPLVAALMLACVVAASPAGAQDRGDRDRDRVQRHDGPRDRAQREDRSRDRLNREDGRRDWNRRDRDRRDGDRRWSDRGYRDDYRRHYDGPRYYAGPSRPYRRFDYDRHYDYDYDRYYFDPYYDPFWYFVPPPIAYPAPPYVPEPIIVERIYEPEPIIIERGYEPAPPEGRAERYQERSYAEAAPAPRMERFTLSARELFEFDGATLRTPHAELDRIAEAMKRNPQIDRVTITGHTDRIGSEAYNRELSQRRAEAVKDYLVGKGVAAERLVAVGKGESEPVVQCRDTDSSELIRCLEPNRRVEVAPITIERRAAR